MAADYEVLEPGGHQAFADAVKEYADRAGGTGTTQLANGAVTLAKLGDDVTNTLDSKAEDDGYYAQMTVGAADNLTGRGDAVPATYLHRTAGGTASIESGQATVESIHGRSLRWNQGGRFVKWSGESPKWGSGFNSWSISADGRSASIENGVGTSIIYWSMVPTGHKVYFSIYITASGTFSNQVVIGFGGTYVSSGVTLQPNTKTRVAMIGTMGTTNSSVAIYPDGTSSSVTCDYTLEDFQLIDLTAMFGAGNEPSTVAEFEALYPLPYYPYDAGSLLPVRMQGIETTGFNQWDEEWEVGAISPTTGGNTNSTTTIRSKNFIPVFPDTEYCISIKDTTANYIVVAYDADKNYIKYLKWAGAQGQKVTFTTPEDAAYIRFNVNNTASGAYGTTYKNDICVNLVWSGIHNGEYEAHWKSQRAIDVAQYFPDGMRGAGSVYDELTEDAAITRVGSVDLGTLTWVASQTAENAFFANVKNVMDYKFASSVQAQCVPYTFVGTTGGTSTLTTDKAIALYYRGSTGTNIRELYVKDTAYTDAAVFKTAMSGVMLHYELATPTTTPIDPPLNLTYRVDDWGTERVMVDEAQPAPQSAPPTMQVAYGVNAIDTLRNMPKDYISAASDTNLCAALASALGLTITRTWDATKGEYDYAITQSGE